MNVRDLRGLFKGVVKGRLRKEFLAAVMIPTLYARRHDYGMGTSHPKEFVKMAMDFADRIVKSR